MRHITTIVLLSLLSTIIIAQTTYVYSIFPLGNFTQSAPNPRACYANCQFCQISNGQCQQCYTPFFTKDPNGQCVSNANYTLESSRNQLRSGNSFIPSVSWSNQSTTTCLNTLTLRTLGPFSSQLITYRRSISPHNYFTIKLMLLKINWNANSQLNITINSELGVTIFQTTILYTPNVANCTSVVYIESLCSTQPTDQRFSIKLQFQDRITNELNIVFNGSMSNGAQWGISTFSLTTGVCAPNCQYCNLSPNPNQCINCTNFFSLTSNTCNQCSIGFQLVTVNSISTCRKCPIQFATCTNPNILCFYNNSLTTLNASTCLLNQPNNYADQIEINDIRFTGSLYTVDGFFTSNICGQYSYVGLARQLSTISRVFPTVITHIAVSISFNIIVVDQSTTLQNQPFVLLIDNAIVDTYIIALQATSNVCGINTKNEVFTTFQPTRFISHTKVSNVNISITSNASNWGIRDLRVVWKKCDDQCIECTELNGCNTCNQLFQIVSATCAACTSGYQFNTNATTCSKCIDDNCKQCNNNLNICDKCIIGYYVFEGTCLKNPQYGIPINATPTSWKGVTVNPQVGQSVCTLGSLTFQVFQDNATNKFTIPNPLFKTKVQFRLIKIDNWNPTDFLDVYLNDLRVIHRSYNNVGNKICFASSENDYLSFEQIEIDDNNSTLTVQFEVVKSATDQRKFGIADFKIIPFGCQVCSQFGFDFKATYSFDSYLNVQVLFNRIYRNDNYTDFQTIFKLRNGNIDIPYQVVASDSIRYKLRATLTKQIVQTNLKVICLYPQRVVTSTIDPSNARQFFIVNRALQQISPATAKRLDANTTQFLVQRYTPLGDRINSANSIRQFFNVISRIVIYVGFASFFFGCQTPFTHLMHNFQKIWMHIFVATLSLHPFLIVALSGFKQIQNQNIAINPSVWEDPLPNQIYFDTPAQYQQYFTDISFLRNIYNIGFACAIFLVFYFVIKLILVNWKELPWGQSRLIKHLKVTFIKKPYFYFNSVIFYQYVTLTLLCCLQFIDLTNRTNYPTFNSINAISCIIAYVFATGYPIIHYLYLKHKWSSMIGKGQQVMFVNRYSQIFYRFLPKNLWNSKYSQQSIITFSHLIYNVFRFGQIWWTAIVVSLMFGSAFTQAFLLMIMNFCHLLLVLFTELNYTNVFRWLKALELMFFIGIEIVMLVLVSQVQTMTEQTYLTLGIVCIVFIFMIVTLSIIRCIYTFVKIYREYDSFSQNSKNIDGRMRDIDCYDSVSLKEEYEQR